MTTATTIITYEGSPKWKLLLDGEKYLCIGNALKDKEYSKLLHARLDAVDMIELSMILDDERFAVEPVMILCMEDSAMVLPNEKNKIEKGDM